MAHADELGADLVVLSTHGQGGLKGFFLGSIALRALGRGRTPILMVNPTTAGDVPPFICRRILVPLDGSATHETALPVAERLAPRLEGRPPPRDGGADGSSAVRPQGCGRDSHAAGDAGHAGDRRARCRGVRRRPGEHPDRRWIGRVLFGGSREPLTALLETARTTGADLVVMATHARGAMEGFWPAV